MILIYLDGTLVVSDSTKTIKMTKENPGLTKKGEYSLEIEFPMSIPDNKNFFGPINRSEVTNMTVTHSAEIYDGSRLLVRGQSMITSITDDTAKVQVKTVFGNALEVDERYIDEIQLGYVTFNFTPEFPASEAYRMNIVEGDPHDTPVSVVSHGVKYRSLIGIAFGVNKEATSPEDVSLSDGGRVYEGEDDTHGIDCALPERVGLNHLGEDGKIIFIPVYDITNGKEVNRQRFMGYERLQCPEAMQVNLKWLVERVFTKLGYSVDWTGLSVDSGLLNSLYIANACISCEIRHVLPHWTVSEFVNQLSVFFNHTIYVSGSEVKFTSNALQINTINKLDIEDGIEKEIGEEAEDISFATTHNVEYKKSEEHDYDFVDQDIMDSFEHIEVEDRTEAENVGNSLNTEFEETDDTTGHGSYGGDGSFGGGGYDSRYIYVTPGGFYCRGTDPVTGVAGLVKINHFGQLTHDENSEEYTELKISPVAIEAYDENCHESAEWHYPLTPIHHTYIRLLDPVPHKALRPKLANKRTFPVSQSVWSTIQSGDSEITQPEDLLQLFIYDGYTHKMRSDWENGTTCAPFTDAEYKQIPGISEKPDTRPDYSLSINRSTSAASIAELQGNSVKINLTKKERFKFLSSTPPDTSGVFLIRGKKYLCEKVEYDITDSGVHPLMTGYFYEIVE